MSDDDRPILTVKTPRLTAAVLEQQAFEKLWLMPEFRIFLFTLFRTASMFEAAYGTHHGHLDFIEGRRSLGFNILRSAQNIEPDALALILAAGYKLQKEAPNGKRRRYDHDRLSELDRSDGRTEPDPRAESAGFLDYGDDTG